MTRAVSHTTHVIYMYMSVCAAYVTQWEELLNEQLAVLAQSRDLAAEFRNKMQKEERMSRRIQPRH